MDPWKPCFGEEYLCSGKPFDDVHGSLTARTWPSRSRLVGQRSICWRRLVEHMTTERKQPFAFTVGQPAEVAYTREASG